MRKTPLPFLLALLLAACDQPGELPVSAPEAAASGGDQHFLILQSGDSIRTGVPFPARGKVYDLDSLGKPETMPSPSAPKLIATRQNTRPAGAPKMVKIPDSLTVMEPGKNGTPLPETVSARGKIVIARQPPSVPASPPQMKEAAVHDIRYLDVNEGLSGSYVYSIMQDRRGHIWIGTWGGGLSRYDGTHFTHYTTAEGLADNHVRPLLEDRRGAIWIGTAAGLSCYDGNRFITYTTREGLPHNEISSLLEDRRGNIWIGTLGGGATCLRLSEDGTSGSFTQYTTETGLAGNSIFAMLEDKRGDLWFGSPGGGLSRYTPPSAGSPQGVEGRFTQYTTSEGLVNQVILSLLEDRQGNVWLGTGRGLSQLVLNEQGEGRQLIHYTQDEGLPGDVIQALLEDAQGNIWTGGPLGASKLVRDEQGRDAHFIRYGRKDGLSQNQVRVLFEDNQGNLWLGTDGGGLCRYNRKGFNYPMTGEGLHNNNVWSIKEDSRGALWFGTLGGDIIHAISPGSDQEDINGQFSPYTIKEGLGINATSILEDKNGEMWFGAWSGGLTHYVAGGKGSFTRYFGNTWFYSLLADSRGDIWCSGGGRVGKIQWSTAKTGGQVTMYSREEGLSDYDTWTLFEDSRRNVWFGTAGGGVVRLIRKADGTEESFTLFTTHEGLSDNRVWCIMEDQQGRLWFGTDGGLSCFDPEKEGDPGSFTNYTTREGLSHNIVLSIVEDDQQRIWASTENGLNVLMPATGDTGRAHAGTPAEYTIFTFDKSDGLKSTVFSSIGQGVCLDHRNRLWWGAFNGLTMLDLNNFELPATPPAVRLNSINVAQTFVDYRSLTDSAYQRVLPFGKVLAGAFDSMAPFYNYPTELTLPHQLNHLTFQFSAIDWAAPHKVRYSYRMQGLDENWSPLSTESKADYRNLPPGRYSFQVKAVGAAQLDSDVFSYEFTVRPPWWRTWWAYLLYAALILMGLFLFFRGRMQALQQQNRQLEEKVTQRTRQLQKRVNELSTVNEISQAAAGQLQFNDLIRLVGEQMRTRFDAQIAYVAILDRATRTIRFPYQYGDNIPSLRLGEGLTSRIIQSGEPLLINEQVAEAYRRYELAEVGAVPHSYLGVPVPVSGEVIGVLSVQRTDNLEPFDEADRRLLSTIAANVGIAIHNARLYQEAQDAKIVAEEANEAKSAFLSTISHELRTPLTSVIGFAKIIRKRLEERLFPLLPTDDGKTQRTVQQVSDNLNVVISEGERLTALINDILDLAKIEAGRVEWKMEELAVGEIIDRAAAATNVLFAERGLPLYQDVAPELPPVVGDRDRLQQVLINLLSNAVKFTPAGSVTVKAVQREGEIVISVVDTGVGIAPEDQAKIFEKFKQAGDTLTDKPKGTGLGLPICKEIVEHHGGRLWVESQPGKGSTFAFSLPRKDSRPESIELTELMQQLKAQVQHTAPSGDNGPATILVVDDEAHIRDLLRQELTDSGYLVREAANGRQAIEVIRRQRPDLVILDVMMPEMNGFDVAAVLKNDPKTMDIPILILSIVQDKERGLRLGVDRYLTKPIDTAALFREVGALLEQGKSTKKVLIVDENNATVQTLAEVLHARGYQVVEANGPDLIEKAVQTQPDIIILNSLLSANQEVLRTLRFEKGLEKVLFLIYH